MDNTPTILILEDDNFLSGLAATKIQKEGMRVVTKAKGEEALTAVETEKPSLILIDLMLPGMSGFEFLETLYNKPDNKEIKTIVFSNLGDETDVERAKQLGANEFLIKASFTLDELVEKIKEYTG